MWSMKRRQDDELEAAALAAEVAVVRALRERHPTGAIPVFGVPGPCLRCGDVAMVERVHETAGRARHRCVSCGAAWTVTRRAIEAVSDEVDLRRVVVGDGTLVAPLLTAGADRPDRWRRRRFAVAGQV